MSTTKSTTKSAAERLADICRTRIALMDGAMGTQIQALKLAEEDFRADRFKDHHADLRGNNDLLVLTQPQAIEAIHARYLKAGADIVSTNTFNATRIAQADYATEDLTREINREGARLARAAADAVGAEENRPCFVAGALGPTNRTASISPDVTNPGYRAVTFDDLREAYEEAATGLLEGGADLFLIETVFDTLNAKAALMAVRRVMRANGPHAARPRLRHDHRQVRPHAVRPDADGVLELGPPCRSFRDRPQLRAGRRGDAPAYRGNLRASRHLHPRLPQCRPAQRLRRL